MVGFATDSVFLKTVVETDLVPSRSWGFDYGRNGLGNETKGELVIGGYNSEKASYKDFTNLTVFPDKNKPCPLQVNVKKIKMGNVDLMAGQGKFRHFEFRIKGFFLILNVARIVRNCRSVYGLSRTSLLVTDTAT
jgi:hypothetical protein